MYDIFYISKERDRDFLQLKERFPLLRLAKYEKRPSESLFYAQKKSFTNFFWIIDQGFQVNKDFLFDYEVPEWDMKYIHLFKHTNGVCLIPKKYNITKKEVEYDFFVNSKEIDIVAGEYPSNFDIVFISYNEPNADENFNRLRTRYPNAKRINGIKGIHQAHIEAAKIVNSKMFWIVDGDAILENDFDFEKDIPNWSKNTVYVFESKNSINDLNYGYGGVKFLPRDLVLSMDVNSVDMTTSISKSFKSIPKISNITAFNTDPFSTWKSAFRECVKLSSRIINGQVDDQSQNRLDIWCTVGADKPFGEYSIKGALAGKEFGRKYVDNTEMLKKINDWEWLENEFRQ